MRELLAFLSKWYFFIFFIFLESLALSFLFSKNYFHEVFLKSSTNFILGSLYEFKFSAKKYFYLNESNERLREENALLRGELEASKMIRYTERIKIQDPVYIQQYTYTPTKIIENSIHQTKNFITINKGQADGVLSGMGIILSDGIVGMVVKTSANFSKVISILNTEMKINARIKESGYFGFLNWDGKDSRFMDLREIPKHADIQKGQIVETDGKSSIFPEGIPVGVIEGRYLDKQNGNAFLRVKLNVDMSLITEGYIVESLFKEERKSISL